VGRLGEKYAISVKLVDLKTQRNEKSFTEYYQGAEEDLDQVMRYVAGKLAGLSQAPLAVKPSNKPQAKARPQVPAPAAAVPVQGPKKSAVLAGLLSLGVPGLGQVYNGQSGLKGGLLFGLGAGGQIFWIVAHGKGLKAQEEYDAFLADPRFGLLPAEGDTEVTGYEHWADEYRLHKRNEAIGFSVRLAASLYAAGDAYLFARKHRRGSAFLGGRGPALALASFGDGAQASLTWRIP
jgi:hypothetical protein